MKKRSVAAVVIFDIITCGIYGLYWLYVTEVALQEETKTNNIPPILTLLLSLFLGSIGCAIYGYDAGQCFKQLTAERGTEKDSTVLYLILGLLVSPAMIGVVQNDINNYLAGKN